MIIYKATNIVNGKCYIGQTVSSLRVRINGHIKESKRSITNAFHNAINKYGKNSFMWEVLCECDTKEELNDMEYHYIKSYHSHISENGYNILWGESRKPFISGINKHTKEYREYLKRAYLGSNNPFYGKKHTEETRLKMSHKGKNNPFYGKKHTEETRLKMSGFIWIIEDLSNGDKTQVIVLKSWCDDNNISYSNAKYHIKTHGIYMGYKFSKQNVKS